MSLVAGTGFEQETAVLQTFGCNALTCANVKTSSHSGHALDMIMLLAQALLAL
jgi:hypothetical protein